MIILVIIVTLLTVLQSMFGVGLLLFGTPLLLTLGLPFHEALSYLLPCSAIVSAFQTYEGWNEIGTIRKTLPYSLLPLIVLGLLFILKTGNEYNIKFYVGIMLLVTGGLRLSPYIQRHLQSFFTQHMKLSFATIGLIHGTTNLGGGPWTIMVNALFKRKEAIRANIAYGYLLMAATQIMTLFAMGKFVIGMETIFLPIISLLTFLFLGNRIFHIARQQIYYHLMTGLILSFGLLLMN